MRRRHVWHKGEWVDVTGWKRPPQVAPYIIRDGMDALRHPCTGDMIESKSEFRRLTRANGCVEVGDEAPTSAQPPPALNVREALIDAYQKVRDGYTPPPPRDLSAANTEDGIDAPQRIYTPA